MDYVMVWTNQDGSIVICFDRAITSEDESSVVRSFKHRDPTQPSVRRLNRVAHDLAQNPNWIFRPSWAAVVVGGVSWVLHRISHPFIYRKGEE